MSHLPLLLALTLALTAGGCTQHGKAEKADHIDQAPLPPLASESTAEPIAVPHGLVPTAPLSPDTAQKLEQLENDLRGIQSEIAQTLPAVQKLETLEARLQTVVTEMERLRAAAPASEDKASAPPVSLTTAAPQKTSPTPGHKPQKPAAKPAKTKAAPLKASTQDKTPSITRLRIGQHPDKTRFVMDLSAPAKFRYDLDNGEKLLIVDLDGAHWTAKQQDTIRNSPLVESYAVQQDPGQPAQLVITLKRAAKVAGAWPLPPSGDYGHRLVLDIVPEK